MSDPTQAESRFSVGGLIGATLVILLLGLGVLVKADLLDVEVYQDSVALTAHPQNNRRFYTLEVGANGVDYRAGYHPCPY